MKKLMCIEEYIQHRYTEKSRPSKKVIIGLIKKGEISGGIKLGRIYYVDVDLDTKVEKQTYQPTGNLLIDRVLRG